MCNLIVMTFDNREEAVEIQRVLCQLKQNNQLSIDSALISKDREGNLTLGVDDHAPWPASPSAKASAEVASDKAFVQNVLESLPRGNTALLMVTGEDDSSTAILTVLMLFTPNAIPALMTDGKEAHESQDALFQQDLEFYQAAVANLEALGADSSEGDVEEVFQAVDDAYDRLVYFISPSEFISSSEVTFGS